eukprot:COSAG02_NODE_491_length_21224_cov_5.973680_7_plen_138_part_00
MGNGAERTLWTGEAGYRKAAENHTSRVGSLRVAVSWRWITRGIRGVPRIDLRPAATAGAEGGEEAGRASGGVGGDTGANTSGGVVDSVGFAADTAGGDTTCWWWKEKEGEDGVLLQLRGGGGGGLESTPLKKQRRGW